MGYGDDLMASGMARGAAARGKRIAFGNGQRIIWGPWSPEIFQGNPNVAPPGSDNDPDLEWIPHYKGHRAYNRLDAAGWIWNMNFRPTPGEVFFDAHEQAFARSFRPGFIVIEPNAPPKRLSPNKQWRVERFQDVATRLMADGHRVTQPVHSGSDFRIEGADLVATPGFRHALALISRAALYIGPEGGLHHGAAAVGVRAVVIFGGFVPTSVTGYPTHVNLAAGEPACGSTQPCDHCRQALDAITADTVYAAATSILREQASLSSERAAQPGA
jgi:ADP-heptose:LPS heptosyltransferase